jgi:acylpyruvate hydrolase
MRYVSYEHAGRRHAGVVDADRVIPLEGLTELGPSTNAEDLRQARRRGADAVPRAEVRLLPVVPNPGKVICVGLNYLSHVEETGRDLPTYPVLFIKFASALIGAADPVTLPAEATQVDWEGELAVVIGTPTRRVPAAQASAAVLGYTVANDITMRDFQYKTHQWLQGKAWDHSTPLGPELVTPEEIDPGALDIGTYLNGRKMQASTTARMIFNVATLISTISTFTTLMPGDVILTGTPEGVDYRRDPQVFLNDGDVVSVTIEELGSVQNRIAAER